MDKVTEKLGRIYALMDSVQAGWELACKMGCSVCCTTNLVVTSVEALYIAENLRLQGRSREARSLKGNGKRFIPKTTVNRMAKDSFSGGFVEEDEPEDLSARCPFLRDEACSIYPLRPVGCRIMVSKRPCFDSGSAYADEFMISMAQLFMQVVEHLDAEGISGNIADLLPLVASSGGCENIKEAAYLPEFVTNTAIEVIVIPPEHRAMIMPVWLELKRIMEG